MFIGAYYTNVYNFFILQLYNLIIDYPTLLVDLIILSNLNFDDTIIQKKFVFFLIFLNLLLYSNFI